MSKWIDFDLQVRRTDRKTDIWLVVPKREKSEGSGVAEIGEVKWFGSWRKYCFFPRPSTVFEKDCLRDIAAFCEEQTAKWGAAKRVEG